MDIFVRKLWGIGVTHRHDRHIQEEIDGEEKEKSD